MDLPSPLCLGKSCTVVTLGGDIYCALAGEILVVHSKLGVGDCRAVSSLFCHRRVYPYPDWLRYSIITLAISQMAVSANENPHILIVGAGTWGCSTALHLARRGYKSVTLLDPYPVPSPICKSSSMTVTISHQPLLYFHSCWQ